MRRLCLILTFFAFAVSACAGSHDSSLDTGTTGQLTDDGVPYVTNGNKRMAEALKNDPPPAGGIQASTVSQPVTSSTAATSKELRLRLKEFQITRYKKNEFKPSRFGDYRFKITIFFHNENSVEFNGVFSGQNGNWTIDTASDHYRLSGKFTDSQPLKVEGDLKLADTQTNENAHIIYSAYKAKLTIHEDRDKKVIPGSVFEQQLKSLRDHTFGWVHNWMVVRGPAFYLVDIVKQVDSGNSSSFAPPILAFKGESLRTGDQDHPAQSLTPKISSQISLIGNSETSRRRWFQTKFEDPQSKETNDVIIDVQGERESVQGSSATSADGDEDDDLEDSMDQFDTAQPAQPVLPDDVHPLPVPPPMTPPSTPQPGDDPKPRIEPQPGDSQPPAPAQPQIQPPPARPVAPAPRPAPVPPQAPRAQLPAPVAQPLAPGSAYLKIDMSLPRTARMTRDFARNRRIPGVVDWINQYANPKNWHHSDLSKFYYYANPFRSIIETIGRAYDVSPSFAYLTVIESPYFTGGKYKITAETKSTAVGPFQLLEGTAKSLGMIYSGAGDERRYFAPSACGAARYIGDLVKMFENSDTTVSILGYYQGQGGAARAIVCTYSGGDCKGKNYSRYLSLAKNYAFTYKQIDSVAAIPKDQRDYVNKKLAIYFISEDISKYSFQTGGVNSLRGISNIFPSRQISDGVCRQAVNGMTGI